MAACSLKKLGPLPEPSPRHVEAVTLKLSDSAQDSIGKANPGNFQSFSKFRCNCFLADPLHGSRVGCMDIQCMFRNGWVKKAVRTVNTQPKTRTNFLTLVEPYLKA